MYLKFYALFIFRSNAEIVQFQFQFRFFFFFFFFKCFCFCLFVLFFCPSRYFTVPIYFVFSSPEQSSRKIKITNEFL